MPENTNNDNKILNQLVKFKTASNFRFEIPQTNIDTCYLYCIIKNDHLPKHVQHVIA